MINWTLQIFIKSTWHNPPTTTHTDSLQKKPASNHFPGPDAELERLIWPFLRLAFCVPRDFQTLGEALITVPQWFPVTSVLKKREGMVSKFGCFWLKVKEVCYKPLHFDYIYILYYIYTLYIPYFFWEGGYITLLDCIKTELMSYPLILLGVSQNGSLIVADCADRNPRIRIMSWNTSNRSLNSKGRDHLLKIF